MTSTNFKTALITGASNGIGYHLAQLFARDRHGLILVARTKSDLEKVAKELTEKYPCPQVIIIAKDLSKPGSARELFKEIKEHYHMPIHFLINNAGVGLRGKVWETDIDRDIQMIHLNIISLVELTKLILPEMIERNEGQILMLGSIASFQPNPLLASYGATKAFIANYTDALIDELKDTNVTVTLLVPGVTDTDFFNKADASETKANHTDSADDPADVAQRGYDALINGEHRVYGSTKVKLMVGVGQVIPNEFITKATRSFMKEEK
jgi:short-subunit dehydrogenase